MSLVNAFRDLANRMGLIRIVTITETTNHAHQTTRTVTLADLTAEVKSEQLEDLAALPAELSVPFEQIFAAAGIKMPAHGWNLPKLGEFLASPACKGLAKPELQKAVLAALAAGKVPPEDLVKDAIARDRAIDTYGNVVHRNMMARKASRSQRLAEIEAQLHALQEEAGAIRESDQHDRLRWVAWWQQKTAYEKEMAQAVNVLMEGPVVTIDEAMPPDDNLPNPGAGV